MGVDSITPEEGLQLLSLLLSQPNPQVGAIPIDWPSFSEQLAAGPFFARLRHNSERAPVDSARLIKDLAERPVAERRDYVLTQVQAHIATVLGLPTPEAVDVQQGFFDLGMDSLTSIELKNQLQTTLGCSLPATLIFKYPTTEKLVDYLVTEVLHVDDVEPVQGKPEVLNEKIVARSAEEISEEDIETLIDAEFDALISGEE
jgi:acyl carrier protein